MNYLLYGIAIWISVPELISTVPVSNELEDHYKAAVFKTVNEYVKFRKYNYNLWPNGSKCVRVETISVDLVNNATLNTSSLVVRIELHKSAPGNSETTICQRAPEEEASHKSSTHDVRLGNTTTTSLKSKMRSIFQTIGICVFGALLAIFFFIAGYLRLKNCMRRNNTNLRLNSIRFCLTTEDDGGGAGTSKWNNSMTEGGTNNNFCFSDEHNIASYLQMQSMVDKNISQFMVKQSMFKQAREQDSCSKLSSTGNTKRKNSIKVKLQNNFRRLDSITSQNHTDVATSAAVAATAAAGGSGGASSNQQRRHSVTSEIDSVMNKHFSMLGLSKRSTAAITTAAAAAAASTTGVTPPVPMLHRSATTTASSRYRHQQLHHNSHLSLNKRAVGGQQRVVMQPQEFTGRRATTIGGHRSISTHQPYQQQRQQQQLLLHQKQPLSSSHLLQPDGNTGLLGNSTHSVTMAALPSSSSHPQPHRLRKQTTLDDSVHRYYHSNGLLDNSANYSTSHNQIPDFRLGSETPRYPPATLTTSTTIVEGQPSCFYNLADPTDNAAASASAAPLVAVKTQFRQSQPFLLRQLGISIDRQPRQHRYRPYDNDSGSDSSGISNNRPHHNDNGERDGNEETTRDNENEMNEDTRHRLYNSSTNEHVVDDDDVDDEQNGLRHSRCSSADKTSSFWSSLDAQEIIEN